MADEDVDPFDHAVAKLTPAARSALRRSLLLALGLPRRRPPPLAVDLVNTEVEMLDLTLEPGRLGDHIARASRDGERAPPVLVGHAEDYALLTSAQHLWRLVDRVDELELAIRVLASACVRGLAQAPPMERLLEQLDA